MKVIAVTFPNMEKAMIPAITRGAVDGPNTAPKNTVAMSSLQLSSIDVGFAMAASISVWLNLSTESLIERH